MIGTFLGGWLGDRMSHRDVRWYVWLPAIANLIGLPFGVFFYLWHDPVVALLFCTSVNVNYSVINGKVAVREGHLTTLELEPLIERHNAIAKALVDGEKY